jgi:polysaccharide export outer membrane protein
MTLGYFRLLAVSFLVAMLVGCSSAGNVRSRVATLQAPDSTNTAGAYEGASDYRVGAQDLLEISVFGVDSLNKTVRVNSNGQITLPLIGGVQAGGHTIPELEQEIAAKLSKSYLQNPQVSVFVKEYTSQRITLEGALKNPGIYPITGKTTLLQSVALAGGLDPLADLGGVVVFRQVKGKKMAAVFDMRKLRSGQMADPQVYGDDMIVVEASNSKTALRRFLEAVPGLGLFFLVL